MGLYDEKAIFAFLRLILSGQVIGNNELDLKILALLKYKGVDLGRYDFRRGIFAGKEQETLRIYGEIKKPSQKRYFKIFGEALDLASKQGFPEPYVHAAMVDIIRKLSIEPENFNSLHYLKSSSLYKNLTEGSYFFTEERADSHLKAALCYTPFIKNDQAFKDVLIDFARSRIDRSPFSESLPLQSANDDLDSMLPPVLVPWIEENTRLHQCDRNFLVAFLIVALGTALQNKVCMFSSYPNYKYVEGLIFWALAVGPSGSNKTAPFNAIVDILNRLENSLKARFAQDMEAYERRHGELKREVNGLSRKIGMLERKGADASSEGKARLRDLETALAEKEEQLANLVKPVETRFTTNDATPEKLIDILNRNSRPSLCLARDEFSSVFRRFEQPTFQELRKLLLEAYSGYGNFKQDRIGRGTLSVDRPAVSIMGGIQTSVLRTFIEAVQSGKVENDGFLQRFHFLAYSPSVKEAGLDRSVPDEEKDRELFKLFQWLVSLQPEKLPGIKLPPGYPPGLAFTKKAAREFDECLKSLRPGQYDNPAMQSHVAKAGGFLARLACLFQLVDWFGTGKDLADLKPGVSSVNLRRAIAVYEVFKGHAQAMYDTRSNPNFDAANSLLSKVMEGKVKNGSSVRDILRHNWTHLNEYHTLLNAIGFLRDRKILVLHEKQSTAKGGRPNQVIVLNPQILFRLMADGKL